MFRRRLKEKLKSFELMIFLAVLAAIIAVMVSLFLQSFYAYDPLHYQPKDTSRGKYLESQEERRD